MYRSGFDVTEKDTFLLAEAAGTVDEFRKQREHIIAAMRKTSFK